MRKISLLNHAKGRDMIIPEKLKEILKHEGAVAIATQGKDGPHLVNTWHSYVQFDDNENLLIPVGRMKQTEANLQHDNRILVTLGSREVTGLQGRPGAGFLIRGTARIVTSGPKYALVLKKFSWARAALEVTVQSAEETL